MIKEEADRKGRPPTFSVAGPEPPRNVHGGAMIGRIPRRSSCHPASPSSCKRSRVTCPDSAPSSCSRVNLLPERIQLRPALLPSIARRFLRAQRAADGVAITARPPRDHLDRQPRHRMHPADLGPLLHPDHRPPPGSLHHQTSQAPRPPRQRDTPAARGVHFRPARVGEYSGGADTQGHSRAVDLDPGPSATLSLVRFGQALSVPSAGRTLIAPGAVRLGRRARLGELRRAFRSRSRLQRPARRLLLRSLAGPRPPGRGTFLRSRPTGVRRGG